MRIPREGLSPFRYAADAGTDAATIKIFPREERHFVGASSLRSSTWRVIAVASPDPNSPKA